MKIFFERIKKYTIGYYLFIGKNILLKPIHRLLVNYRCLIWKVEIKGHVNFLGVPRFRNLGKIRIGNGTRIISDNRNVVGSEVKTTFQTGIHGEINIGENCGISNCCIVSQSKITIGDYVYIGGGVRIYDNDFHSVYINERLNKPNLIPSKEVIIGDRVFIGGHSIILKGVKIGNNAVIGAGSIVTNNVSENQIWAGVPAKKVKDL